MTILLLILLFAGYLKDDERLTLLALGLLDAEIVFILLLGR